MTEYMELGFNVRANDTEGLMAAKRLIAVARTAAEADGDTPYARGYRAALSEMRKLINHAIAQAK